MEKSHAQIVITVVHDRVASMDSYPRIFGNDAQAMREFKQNVNMPSEFMTFHAPGDFEVVKIGQASRDDEGNMIVEACHRTVLLTGSAAFDQSMRDRYVMLSKTQKGELADASQSVS